MVSYQAPAKFGTGGKITTAAIILGVCGILVSLEQAIMELTGNGAMARLGTQRTTTTNPLSNFTNLYGGSGQTVLSFAAGLAGLALTAAFAIWIYRAVRNLQVFQGAAGGTMSPTFALVGSIVPFMSLIVPYLALRQIWRISSSQPDDLDMLAWKRAPVLSWINFWFALIVVAGVLAIIVSFVAGFAAALHGLTGSGRTTAETGMAIVSLLAAVSNVLRVLIVRRVDGLQQSRFDGGGDAGFEPAPVKGY